MMIKEYMRAHPGTYLLAESVEVVTEQDLAPELAELEVEEYVLGGGESAPERIRLHTCSGHSHVLTYIAERETAPQR